MATDRFKDKIDFKSMSNWYIYWFFSSSDLPTNTQVPPLTPGTNQKMTAALAESFKNFSSEQRRLQIPKGETQK